jgi:hypothetical protein
MAGSRRDLGSVILARRAVPGGDGLSFFGEPDGATRKNPVGAEKWESHDTSSLTGTKKEHRVLEQTGYGRPGCGFGNAME